MVNICIQISIFFMFIGVIWSSPKCRYVQINEEFYPIGYCNAIYDPTTSLLKSFVFSCNTTNSVLMTESIGTQDCSGGNTQITDITQQIVDFNCRLPLCTDNAIVYEKQNAESPKSETKQTVNGNALYIVIGTLVIFILLLFILFCIWIKRIVREPSKLKIETENEWRNQSEHDDELELVTTTR
eukprot:107835_1